MRESDELTPTYDLPDLKPAESPEPPDRKPDPPNDLLYLVIEFIIVDVILRTLWMTGYLVVFTLGFLVLAIVVVLLVCVIAVAPHWWMNNYETAFMEANQNQPIVREWVDIDHMSRNALAAAIVLEDVDFGDRVLAFNIDKFIDTAQQHMAGLEPEGGSTIPQQLAKNLYLSESRSALRKALEAPLSMVQNAMLSDQRTLELYFNYAQFGPRLYGICAAAWYYFDTPPWSMSEYEAAQLVAILPFPSEARRANGGGIYVLGEKSSQRFNEKVYTLAPDGLAWVGGYAPLMERTGIEGTAADHADTRWTEGSCSTMPDDVRAMLVADGFR